MIFLTGLRSLGREEKLQLLAYLNVLTPADLVNHRLQGVAARGKRALLRVAGRVASRFSDKAGESIQRFDRRTDWHPQVLRDRLERAYRLHAKLETRDLNGLLRYELARLGRVDYSVTDQRLAEAVVERATAARNVSGRRARDHDLAEAAVFEQTVKDLVDRLQQQLGSLTPEQAETYREQLDLELDKLGEGDREAIRQALGLDALSGQALYDFLRSASGVAVAQVALGGTGFGAYLALTTSMKTLGLLLGVTLPFSAYLAATSILAFALSTTFLVLVIAVSGRHIYGRLSSALQNQLAALAVTIGVAKYRQSGRESKYSPLQRHLQAKAGEDAGQVLLTFNEIETILGDTLPASARRYDSWWANDSAGSHVQARAWMETGWRVARADLGEEWVRFERA